MRRNIGAMLVTYLAFCAALWLVPVATVYPSFVSNAYAWPDYALNLNNIRRASAGIRRAADQQRSKVGMPSEPPLMASQIAGGNDENASAAVAQGVMRAVNGGEQFEEMLFTDSTPPQASWQSSSTDEQGEVLHIHGMDRPQQQQQKQKKDGDSTDGGVVGGGGDGTTNWRHPALPAQQRQHRRGGRGHHQSQSIEADSSPPYSTSPTTLCPADESPTFLRHLWIPEEPEDGTARPANFVRKMDSLEACARLCRDNIEPFGGRHFACHGFTYIGQRNAHNACEFFDDHLAMALEKKPPLDAGFQRGSRSWADMAQQFTKNYFERICLGLPARCARLPFAFDVHPRRALRIAPESKPLGVEQVDDRIQCLQQCLITKGCRSLDFDTANLTCTLYAHSLHSALGAPEDGTWPAGQLVENVHLDHYENTCLTELNRCGTRHLAFILIRNAELAGFSVGLGKMSASECLSRCLDSPPAFCRAVQFRAPGNECFLGTERPFALSLPSDEMDIFEPVCLPDPPRTSILECHGEHVFERVPNMELRMDESEDGSSIDDDDVEQQQQHADGQPPELLHGTDMPGLTLDGCLDACILDESCVSLIFQPVAIDENNGQRNGTASGGASMCRLFPFGRTDNRTLSVINPTVDYFELSCSRMPLPSAMRKMLKMPLSSSRSSSQSAHPSDVKHGQPQTQQHMTTSTTTTTKPIGEPKSSEIDATTADASRANGTTHVSNDVDLVSYNNNDNNNTVLMMANASTDAEVPSATNFGTPSNVPSLTTNFLNPPDFPSLTTNFVNPPDFPSLTTNFVTPPDFPTLATNFGTLSNVPSSFSSIARTSAAQTLLKTEEQFSRRTSSATPSILFDTALSSTTSRYVPMPTSSASSSMNDSAFVGECSASTMYHSVLLERGRTLKLELRQQDHPNVPDVSHCERLCTDAAAASFALFRCRTFAYSHRSRQCLLSSSAIESRAAPEFEQFSQANPITELYSLVVAQMSDCENKWTEAVAMPTGSSSSTTTNVDFISDLADTERLPFSTNSSETDVEPAALFIGMRSGNLTTTTITAAIKTTKEQKSNETMKTWTTKEHQFRDVQPVTVTQPPKAMTMFTMLPTSTESVTAFEFDDHHQQNFVSTPSVPASSPSRSSSTASSTTTTTTTVSSSSNSVIHSGGDSLWMAPPAGTVSVDGNVVPSSSLMHAAGADAHNAGGRLGVEQIRAGVLCDAQGMNVTFRLAERVVRYTGVVYAADRFAQCRLFVEDAAEFAFYVNRPGVGQSNWCNAVETHDELNVVLVMSNDEVFPLDVTTSDDFFFHVSCDYRQRHRLNKNAWPGSVSGPEPGPLFASATPRQLQKVAQQHHQRRPVVAEPPTENGIHPRRDRVHLKILRDGRPVSSVYIGERLSAVVESTDVEVDRLRVAECNATRVGGRVPRPSSIPLLDRAGCSLNPHIIGHMRRYANRLEAPLSAFRIDGSDQIDIVCSVLVCRARCAGLEQNQCPAELDHHVSAAAASSLRVHRASVAGAAGKITPKDRLAADLPSVAGDFLTVDQRIRVLVSEEEAEEEKRTLAALADTESVDDRQLPLSGGGNALFAADDVYTGPTATTDILLGGMASTAASGDLCLNPVALLLLMVLLLLTLASLIVSLLAHWCRRKSGRRSSHNFYPATASTELSSHHFHIPRVLDRRTSYMG